MKILIVLIVSWRALLARPMERLVIKKRRKHGSCNVGANFPKIRRIGGIANRDRRDEGCERRERFTV